MWGHPDRALTLVFFSRESSAQVLCSICQVQGEVSLGQVLDTNPSCLGGLCLYITLSLKSLHFESFTFTSKMELERFSETSEWEVCIRLNSLGK